MSEGHGRADVQGYCGSWRKLTLPAAVAQMPVPHVCRRECRRLFDGVQSYAGRAAGVSTGYKKARTAHLNPEVVRSPGGLPQWNQQPVRLQMPMSFASTPSRRRRCRGSRVFAPIQVEAGPYCPRTASEPATYVISMCPASRPGGCNTYRVNALSGMGKAFHSAGTSTE